MKAKIVMLPIEQLENHPDNPRKDVGDVTELANSIKHSGIMQNLTVVPYEGRYRVVIGHRRLAAAKMAGLSELPCMVSDMDHKEQCATMLCENMQRVDLTLVEQAQGVQMMLDLGESVKDIAEKTGFSESTVRKRAKLSALPAAKLAEAENRGGTLEDYLKCLEITDEGKRNELLENVGTRDFLWKYNNFISAQKREANLPLIRSEIKKLAKPLPDGKRYSSEYSQISYVYLDEWTCGTELIPNYDENKTYFYYFEYNTMFVFQKVKKQKSQPAKKSKKEIEADKARARLAGLTKTAFEMRSAFLEEFNVFTPQNEKIIDEAIVILAAHKVATYATSDNDFLKNCIKPFKDNDGYTATFLNVQAWFYHNRKKAKIQLLRALFSDDERNGFYTARYCDIMPEYAKNERLQAEYNVLAELGYNISTEEMQLMNGTHELFRGEEK